MRRFFASLLGVPVGYVVFAVVGYGAIMQFSPNGFDRSVEASMTAAFAIGPLGAVIGLVTGFILGGRKRKSVPAQPPE
jgi:Na+/glutamate symporter